jgi:hypothetical protein
LGVDYTSLQALAFAKASGVDFSKTILLGHQELHVGRREVKRILEKFSIPLSASDIERIFKTRFADDLFRHLGAIEVESIDAAEYEGASIIHDMNTPITDNLHSSHTLVFDGGTLEHVFNFPVASANVIKMAAVGGHILSLAPANNLCGHGFYQFSPELFFRVFGPPNGCRVISLFMADTAPHRAWQRVTDPQLLRRRVNLHHVYATTMVMLAVKQTDQMESGFVPQQSDYEFGAWKDEGSTREQGRLSRAKAIARELLPVAIWSRFMALRDFLTHTGYLDGYTRVVLEKIVHRDPDI